MDKCVNDKYRDQDFDRYWISTLKGLSSRDVIKYKECGRSEAYGVWMARQVEINNLEAKTQELEAKNKTLEEIIERGDLISDNWQNNCYQEATHYNWLDDENHRVEQENMNLKLTIQELEAFKKEALETFVNIKLFNGSLVAKDYASEFLSKHGDKNDERSNNF